MDEKFSVESHFTGKDQLVWAIYEKLLLELRQFGEVFEESKQTSIHLVNKSAFAGVSIQKAALVLNIKSSAPLESLRFTHREKVSANRYHQEIRLSAIDDLDEELLGWLKQAYILSA